MFPRDLLCDRDDDFPHLEKKTFRFFVLSRIFLSWAIEREEFVNLLCDIRRRECGVRLKIRIENVEDSLIHDPWVWILKDEGGRISYDDGTETSSFLKIGDLSYLAFDFYLFSACLRLHKFPQDKLHNTGEW